MAPFAAEKIASSELIQYNLLVKQIDMNHNWALTIVNKFKYDLSNYCLTKFE